MAEVPFWLANIFCRPTFKNHDISHTNRNSWILLRKKMQKRWHIWPTFPHGSQQAVKSGQPLPTLHLQARTQLATTPPGPVPFLTAPAWAPMDRRSETLTHTLPPTPNPMTSPLFPFQLPSCIRLQHQLFKQHPS